MAMQNPKIISTVQFDELRNYFKVSEAMLAVKWRLIKHMQADLGLNQKNLPIKELVYLYSRFEEIKEVFKLKSTTFTQLERILIEIETVKDMLDITPTTPLDQVILQIVHEEISSLGVGKNSILERLLQYRVIF